jgi:RHS repeat-associated protein
MADISQLKTLRPVKRVAGQKTAPGIFLNHPPTRARQNRAQVTPTRQDKKSAATKSASGARNHRNRYYSPSLGRWTATDPIKFKAGSNFYKYVENSALNKTDPDGKLSIGPPNPNVNTVVCDGSGGMRVQLAPQFVATHSSDMQFCAILHEQSHIDSTNLIDPDICEGADDGATVRKTASERAGSEYVATTLELDCLRGIAQDCEVKRRIVFLTAYRNTFGTNYP